MADLNSIQHLLSARDVLKSSLEKSKQIAFAIDRTGSRLNEANNRTPSLEDAIKTIANKCILFAVRVHIDRAVGPAVAAVKIFDMVCQLENSLSATSSSDLFDYLYNLKRLEEALRFLTNNCKLVILWLEDVAQFLQDNKLASNDDWYISNVNKCLRAFTELQATEERSRLKGGSLNTAFQKLEEELKLLLEQINFTFPQYYSSLGELTNSSVADSVPLPLPIILKLQAIIETLRAQNRLDRCISIYIDVRSLKAQTTLQSLDLDYLDMTLPITELDSVKADHIGRWGRHLEYIVKHLLELEHRLCGSVFEKVGSDVSKDSFAKIAVQCGMQDLIKFGNTITQGKKEAIKLFKLLDIFAALNKLRMHFNRLFGGKACLEIQTQTRDLINKVVNGACEIFWELSLQVELQRQSSPPPDGSTPRLISFVTDYSNQLLNDNYNPIMVHVMEIHWSWNHGTKIDKELVSKEVHNIVKSLNVNLETWAKAYEDTTLSYLFKMNSYWCLCKNMKGTKLGDLMGESWLKEQEDNVEYYAGAYLRESWGKLPGLLSEEGLILFEGGRAVDQCMVEKRIKAFTEAFDEMYGKQSGWVVSDKGLRWKTWEIVAEVIVPVYKSYVHKYMPWCVEEEEATNVKYSVERLEDIVRSLFQPKIGKYSCSAKCTQLISENREMKNVVGNNRQYYSSTTAAA